MTGVVRLTPLLIAGGLFDKYAGVVEVGDRKIRDAPQEDPAVAGIDGLYGMLRGLTCGIMESPW